MPAPKISAELMTRMVNSLRCGNSVVGACRAHGIALATHYNWCASGAKARREGKFSLYREYLERTHAATDKAVDEALECIFTRGKDGDTKALMWWLSHVARERFGDQIQLNVAFDQQVEGFLDAAKAGLIEEYGEQRGLDLFAVVCSVALRHRSRTVPNANWADFPGEGALALPPGMDSAP